MKLLYYIHFCLISFINSLQLCRESLGLELADNSKQSAVINAQIKYLGKSLINIVKLYSLKWASNRLVECLQEMGWKWAGRVIVPLYFTTWTPFTLNTSRYYTLSVGYDHHQGSCHLFCWFSGLHTWSGMVTHKKKQLDKKRILERGQQRNSQYLIYHRFSFKERPLIECCIKV